MKRMFLLAALILPFLIISCNKDCSYMGTGRVPMKFRSTSVGFSDMSSMTKVIDYSFVEGEKIGIYMIGAGSTLSSSTIVDNVNNYCYYANSITSFLATFEPFSTDTIFFPSPGAVDFISYFPYSNNITPDYKYRIVANTASQLQRQNLDFVYSNNAVNINENSVNLIFKHKLSYLIFEVAAGSGVDAEELDGMNVTMNNFVTSADINLADCSFSGLTTEPTLEFPGKYYTNSNTYSCEGLVIPQTISEGCSVTFTLNNGRVFTYNFGSHPIVLTGGKISYYFVYLHKASDTELYGSVQYWDAGNIPTDTLVIN